MLGLAAIEKRYRDQKRRQRLDGMADDVRREPLQSHAGPSRTLRMAGADNDVAQVKLRFRALLLRRAYVLAEWLPLEAVLNISRIDVDVATKFVVLTLWSGTQLLDTGDRITVKGEPDDITVKELVACVARRAWTAVKLTGDAEFRAQAARYLTGMGIEVVDNPLSSEEVTEIRRKNSEGDRTVPDNGATMMM